MQQRAQGPQGKQQRDRDLTPTRPRLSSPITAPTYRPEAGGRWLAASAGWFQIPTASEPGHRVARHITLVRAAPMAGPQFGFRFVAMERASRRANEGFP